MSFAGFEFDAGVAQKNLLLRRFVNFELFIPRLSFDVDVDSRLFLRPTSSGVCVKKNPFPRNYVDCPSNSKGFDSAIQKQRRCMNA
ncbi:hypothetical protein AVEN_221885-1 [Araneus ventricosus]|uniref:Uncharacterized protein n=1 Tax=Araneus ventricosus TaxID=182803 RepID=A0A4Y2LSG5_ARAVE|nr:hypothetical protein AVEN_221885-1 [Araneus ventricosus]